MDNRLAILAHFATYAGKAHSTPSLVDSDHVTYTCPTGLTDLPVQSRTHCQHGMDSYNCCQKPALNTRHNQSSHLTQVDACVCVCVFGASMYVRGWKGWEGGGMGGGVHKS